MDGLEERENKSSETRNNEEVSIWRRKEALEQVFVFGGSDFRKHNLG